jgi:hypothetical protein
VNNNIISSLLLIISSGIEVTPGVPGHVQEVASYDRREPNAVDKRETNPADSLPAPSTPSISHGGESGDATPSKLSQLPPVTISSGDKDSPSVFESVREPVKLSMHPLGPGAASGDTPNQKSSLSATADVILRGVVESSDAYPLLKSVARCLCVILDNHEVRFPLTHSIHNS